VSFARVLDLIREDGVIKRAVMTMFRPGELAMPGNTDVAPDLAAKTRTADGSGW
jgi:hypothetical protein